MKHGEGGLSVFVGLNGTKEDLGLKADNYWIFSENNFDELLVFYFFFSTQARTRRQQILDLSPIKNNDVLSLILKFCRLFINLFC